MLPVLRVPFLVVRAAYRIYIDKHTTSIIMLRI